MGKREWDKTDEEKAFLQERIIKYSLAQHKQGPECARQAAEEFVNTFPVKLANAIPIDNLTPEEKLNQAIQLNDAIQKKKKQVIDHVTWHGNKVTKSGDRKRRGKTSILRQVFKGKPKTRRCHFRHAYAKVYPDRIEKQLKIELQKMENYLSTLSSRKRSDAVLGMRSKLATRLWLQEKHDPEVFKAVNEAKNKIDEERFGKEGGTNSEDESLEWIDDGDDDKAKTTTAISPRKMQQTIDVLQPLVQDILDELSGLTGWSFSMLMGGLNENGRRETYHAHCGTIPVTNLLWPQYKTNFQQTILDPFIEFIDRVYPIHVQQERIQAFLKKNGPAADESEGQSVCGLGMQSAAPVNKEAGGTGGVCLQSGPVAPAEVVESPPVAQPPPVAPAFLPPTWDFSFLDNFQVDTQTASNNIHTVGATTVQGGDNSTLGTGFDPLQWDPAMGSSITAQDSLSAPAQFGTSHISNTLTLLPFDNFIDNSSDDWFYESGRFDWAALQQPVNRDRIGPGAISEQDLLHLGGMKMPPLPIPGSDADSAASTDNYPPLPDLIGDDFFEENEEWTGIRDVADEPPSVGKRTKKAPGPKAKPIRKRGEKRTLPDVEESGGGDSTVVEHAAKKPRNPATAPAMAAIRVGLRARRLSAKLLETKGQSA